MTDWKKRILISLLIRIWAKGLITDEEMKESMKRIEEKLKAEESKKSIKR